MLGTIDPGAILEFKLPIDGNWISARWHHSDNAGTAVRRATTKPSVPPRYHERR